MKLSDLTQEQRENVSFVLDWANRMTEQFGSEIQDLSGNKYSWFEALCRESYGEDWQAFMQKHNITMPGKEVVEIAKRWEEGDIPEWALYGDVPPAEKQFVEFKENFDKQVDKD